MNETKIFVFSSARLFWKDVYYMAIRVETQNKECGWFFSGYKFSLVK
ncbi:MAG: hypothetical protein V1872_08665 [bacterium]